MKKESLHLLYIILMILSAGSVLQTIAHEQGPKMPVIKSTQFRKAVFNIKSYGAKLEGITLNRISIQAAINECTAKGGGSVIMPAGFWLTGSLQLKTNVNLHRESSYQPGYKQAVYWF